MLLLILVEQYLLVYWEDEDGVSVVVEDNVDHVAPVGDRCSVKCGKSVYVGKVAAVGKCASLYLPSLRPSAPFW